MKIFHVLAAGAVATIGTAAAAVPVASGDTRVAVTADLDALGLTPGLIGTAAIVDAELLTINFPITGGDLDEDLAGQILHEGSGVTLTDGEIILNLENFIIDTNQQTILADVSFAGTSLDDVAVFSFDLSALGDDDDISDFDDPDIELFFTTAAAGVLTDLFNAPDLTGATFGFAATAPEFDDAVDVPAPGALGLLGLGVLAIGMRRRRT